MRRNVMIVIKVIGQTCWSIITSFKECSGQYGRTDKYGVTQHILHCDYSFD